ncbi:Uncharacterised protein [Klebsiella oxytoca]|nr:Uncharacterised protein [Klebsiella oxytoca]
MSHRGTSLLPFSVCENINAAATGVPNSAPMVPEAARIVQSRGVMRGNRRLPTAAARAIFTTIIGCSGPRLTPPARPTISAASRPGSALVLTGAPISDSVAGSGPACPGLKRTISPTAMPVPVRIAIVHKGPSALMPTLAGRLVHRIFCKTAAIFIATIKTRLQAIPMTTAGIDNRSMVLARGCSMKISF